ncbi:MAG: hypothetical protein VB138_01825 [Burkholderia sp.]
MSNYQILKDLLGHNETAKLGGFYDEFIAFNEVLCLFALYLNKNGPDKIQIYSGNVAGEKIRKAKEIYASETNKASEWTAFYMHHEPNKDLETP